MKSCPFCAEQIQDAAIKCRFCGSDLGPVRSDRQVGDIVLTQSSVRPCPFCLDDIPASATICPSCGDDVTYGAKSEPTPEEASATPQSRSQKVSPVGIVIVIAVIGVAYLISNTSSTDAPSNSASSTNQSSQQSSDASREATATSSTARPVLELKKWSWHQTYDYVQVDGQVMNISDTSLKNVSVVASFYDKDGGFITSDSALIDYNPILRGQVSPFRVMSRWNPAMKRADVEFKELMGGKLEHISVSK